MINSWILLSFWLGISYTTTYTSKLASPSYERPINTVRQFLNYGTWDSIFQSNLFIFSLKGLSICQPYLNTDSFEQYRNSVNADLQELSNRSLVHGENAQYRRRLFVERKCGLIAARTRNYISSSNIMNEIDLLPMFRIMRSCTFSQYTGFVFQKYSPFSKLFSWHIRRYIKNRRSAPICSLKLIS